MPTTTYIFNQYYIDFLKRIKTVAKENKDNSTTAKAIYKSIKENYSSLDKSSDEYINFVKQHITDEAWAQYVEHSDTWVQDNKELELYTGISLGNIIKLLDDEYLCHHFITVFYIFRNDLSDEVSAQIVKILQSIDGKELVETIEDETLKKALNNLRELRDKKIKEKAGIDMNFIEDTTLGKLAKEILEDVDVGKLQKSMENNSDILQAIGDPDSGFADIITNVSKKMATKISNGELKQENLIQDAMKFASIMPNLFGGSGAAAGGKKKGGKGPDLSNIMSMMSSMMGSMNAGGSSDEDDCADRKHRHSKAGKSPRQPDMSAFMQGMQAAMQQQRQAPKGARKTVNENALKKIAKAKKLKRKLFEKKKAAAAQAAEGAQAVESVQEAATPAQQATEEVTVAE
jgi:hypothetical protein